MRNTLLSATPPREKSTNPTFFSGITSTLIIFTVLIIICSVGRAQWNSEYHFTDDPSTGVSGQFYLHQGPQSVVDGSGSWVDSVRDLSMDCLAANGYGQWTASSSSSATGWYLLNNSLRPIKLISGIEQPTSIMGNGAFVSGFQQSETKVTANLLGRVRYVSPNSETSILRTAFVVQGLNDYRGVTGDREIDITFPTQTTTPIPALFPIQSSIHPYTSANVSGPIISLTPSDYRDRFDIASDAKYLYIVWRCEGVTGYSAGIYYMALNLSDNSIAQAPIFVAAGFRPTVACDVRNAPSTPTCVTTYLSAIGTGTVQFAQITGSTVAAPSTLSQYFPVGSSTATTYSPLHARVLVSSGATSMGSPSITYGVYVIIQRDATHNSLVLHKFGAPSSVAIYADGSELSSFADADLPSPPLVADAASVVDEPICAFTNPYVGQNEILPNFDQFHCLYRLVRVEIASTPHAIFANFPLLIIRGANNGKLSTSDTRLAVSYIGPYGSPTNLVEADRFVGAVNQYGIHVHWKTNSTATHYYSRDLRRFDEPIEENTLMTDVNVLGDGSGHGGTVGAEVNPGVQVSMWTDPHTVLQGTNASNTYQLDAPQLTLMDKNTSLTIGDNSALTPPASFTSMPVSDIQAYTDVGSLDGNYDYYDTHTVTVNANSKFDCRNTGPYTGFNLSWYPNNSTEAQYGVGAIGFILNGTDALNTGQLFVQPGADFIIGYNGTFTSSYGFINMLTGYSVLDPAHSGSSNTNGLATFIGTAALTNSVLAGNIRQYDSAAVIHVRPCNSAGTTTYTYDLCPTAPTQFYSENCTFENFVSEGLARIDFDANTSTQQIGNVTIDGGYFALFQVYGRNLVNPFSITNSDFEDMLDYGIYLTRDQPTTIASYSGLIISKNNFLNINPLLNSGGTGFYDSLSAVFLYGYYTDAMENVDIEANNFFNIAGASAMNHAIILQNSKGGIINNFINVESGYGYAAGISAVTLSPAPSGLNSLICMNHIENCNLSGYGHGIHVDHYSGYSKLNQVSGCDVGYISDKDDFGHIIFSNFHDNIGAGLDLVDNTALVDLSGVHGPTSSGPDYAAYDTLSNDGVVEILLKSGAGLTLGNNPGLHWSWGNCCENNFIPGSGDDFINSVGGSSTIDYVDLNNFNTLISWISVSALCSTITFTHEGTLLSGMTLCPFSVTCGDGLDIAQKRTRVGIQGTTNDSAGGHLCGWWLNLGSAYQVTGQWQQSFDTLKYYLEHCANDTGSFHAFGILDNANANINHGDSAQMVAYRNWLKSVLYLNTWDPEYFCTCVETIANTYQTNINAYIAVIKYLIGSNRCIGNRKQYMDDYGEARKGQWDYYLTSGVDTSKVHLDTTLPSLHQLGLDTLLNTESVGMPSAISIAFGNVRASENPFDHSTEVILDLHSTAYVRFAVYDELGRNVQGEEMGHVYNPGSHIFHIDGSKLANGVYYARLSTPVGEVQTIKLVKKE